MYRRNFLRRLTAGTAVVAGAGPASARSRRRGDTDLLLETLGTRTTNVVNGASAALRDGELVLVGSLEGTNGCVDVRAGGIEFEDGVPVVTIERTRSGSVCTQAITAVEYRGTLSGLENRPRWVGLRYVDGETGEQFWRDRTNVDVLGRSRRRKRHQVGDASFSVVGVESGTRNTASIGVTGSGVVVDGWIVPDAACHRPVLGDISFGGQQLTVEVETVLQEGSEVCISRPETYNYELSVEISTIPDLAEIRHDGEPVLRDVPDRRSTR